MISTPWQEPQRGSLIDRMKPKKSVDNCYPVIDCPHCGKGNVPLGGFNYYEGAVLRESSYCLSCHKTIKDGFKPKGYVSMEDLEETRWDEEL